MTFILESILKYEHPGSTPRKGILHVQVKILCCHSFEPATGIVAIAYRVKCSGFASSSFFTYDSTQISMDAETLFAYRPVSRYPLNFNTPRQSYTWNYRELATLINLSEILAECGFEPLIIEPMRKNLTTELS